MYNYFLLLLLGHILGDYYFQNDTLSKKKEERYSGVLLHSAIYTICMLLIAVFFWHLDMLVATFCAAVAHFAIDSLKYLYVKKNKKSSRWGVFSADQIIHIVTLLAIAYIMVYVNSVIGYAIPKFIFGSDPWVAIKWIIAFLLILKPSNILSQKFLAEFKPYDKNESSSFARDKQAGRHIGNLERIIMLIFLSQSQYTAIAFVLTAKSIARYEKITTEKEFGEYYLLGTLISAVCVVVSSLIIR